MMNNRVRLCDDTACEKDCVFCDRVKHVIEKKEFYEELCAIRRAIDGCTQLDDWESIDDLMMKEEIIKRRLYGRLEQFIERNGR